MNTIRIKEGNKNFMFICNSRDTRNGFAHDCNLFINDQHVAGASCYYINRTWESWTFQTVCMKALALIIDERKDQLKSDFMESHAYKKLTKNRRAAFNDLISKDIYLAILQRVYNNLYYKLH